jgi:hypothetical protein
MSTLEDVIASAIKSMASVDSDAERVALMRRAQASSLTDWCTSTAMKVAGVGGLTGLAGGPWGLALEATDIAYLFAASGQGCYGVGHILGADIDYECDIPLILAVWSGAADARDHVAVGKVGIKIGGKAAAKAAAKVGGKLLAKIAFKTGSKATAKIAAKVAAKLAAKAAAKLSTKWIPFIGGIVSGGINYWVADGLLDAAKQYYSSDYVVLSDDLAQSADTDA